MRTCHEMGIKTVAIYSDADTQSVRTINKLSGFVNFIYCLFIVAHSYGK